LLAEWLEGDERPASLLDRILHGETLLDRAHDHRSLCRVSSRS
jgi:hypothetical protein